MRAPLRLVVAQTAPIRGDRAGNRGEMQTVLERVACDRPSLVAFPELALTGYDLRMRTAELALSTDDPPPLAPSPDQIAVLGFPEITDDGRVFNAAGAVHDGGHGASWLHRYRKCFLPTYGTFDEGRYFAPSRVGPRVFDAHGWSVATLICEDLWHPSLTYLSALQGADIVVAPTAVPGRRPDEMGAFRSMDRWVDMARALATFHQLWIVVANRAGVEGGLTFGGGSFVVGPEGDVEARTGSAAGDHIELDLDPTSVTRARTRFSHLRDEDGSLLLRELGRLVGPEDGS